MSMNSKEFEQLSKPDQIKIIKEHGVFLADKVVSGDRYFLYAINTFYVELIHELSNIHSKGLAIARIIDDAAELAHYHEKPHVMISMSNMN
jgi:hypothetical protein